MDRLLDLGMVVRHALLGDEDITPLVTTIDYKVSSFLHMHNDKTKNWLQPNMDISNVLRNNGCVDSE
jgi:hypothetical protein